MASEPWSTPHVGEATGGAPTAPAYRIVGTKLAAAQHVHKSDALPFDRKPPRHHRLIVLET